MLCTWSSCWNCPNLNCLFVVLNIVPIYVIMLKYSLFFLHAVPKPVSFEIGREENTIDSIISKHPPKRLKVSKNCPLIHLQLVSITHINCIFLWYSEDLQTPNTRLWAVWRLIALTFFMFNGWCKDLVVLIRHLYLVC